MSYQLKTLCEFAFLWLIAGIALNGDGGERIALVIAWSVSIIGIMSVFIYNDKEYRDAAKKRIKKGYGEESAAITIFQMIPLIASMAYLDNMLLAGLLAAATICMAGLAENINKAVEELQS